MSKTAIFLGAGASKADGAPLQNEIIQRYIKVMQSDNSNRPGRSHPERDGELATFFYLMFGIDIDRDDPNTMLSPTFEEVFGIIDLAERRREMLKDFDLENVASKSNRLRMMRVHLVKMVAQTLAFELETYSDYHVRLIRGIGQDQLNNIVFLSTNYDILIDKALSPLKSREDGERLDYGLDFTNFERERDWHRPVHPATRLHKIHGSLNWLYCPCCNTITLTPQRKIGVAEQPETCEECESVIGPIIVPPTYFKDMANVHLTRVWANAEQDLRQCNHIIFCGYSFPDADIHFKYLMKRIQTNRTNPSDLKFTVINWHEEKGEMQIDDEESRYKRFLGSNVDYDRKMSFEIFAANPAKIIG